MRARGAVRRAAAGGRGGRVLRGGGGQAGARRGGRPGPARVRRVVQRGHHGAYALLRRQHALLVDARHWRAPARPQPAPPLLLMCPSVRMDRDASRCLPCLASGAADLSWACTGRPALPFRSAETASACPVRPSAATGQRLHCCHITVWSAPRRAAAALPAGRRRAAARAGGANVPALNDLLAPFGVAFGDAILEGQLAVDGEKLVYASGANLVRFPAGGYLHSAELADKATAGAAARAPPAAAPPRSGHAPRVAGRCTRQGGQQRASAGISGERPRRLGACPGPRSSVPAPRACAGPASGSSGRTHCAPYPLSRSPHRRSAESNETWVPTVCPAHITRALRLAPVKQPPASLERARRPAAGIARAPGRPGRSPEAAGVHAVLGLVEHQSGRLAVYGDSNCLDSSHQRTPCYALLLKLARWATEVRRRAARLGSAWRFFGSAPRRHHCT